MALTDAQPAARPSLPRLIAFAMPAAPVAALELPLSVYLPPFYVKSLHLGLAFVGSVFFAARLWDIVTIPLLGLIADHATYRGDMRRLWVALATPPLMLASYMTFLPGPTAGPAHIIFWLLVLYSGYELFTLSHLAWGAEIAASYHERTRIQATRQFVATFGTVLTFLIPVAVSSFRSGFSDSARVALIGWLIVAALPVTVFLALRQGPAPTRHAHVAHRIRQALQGLRANRRLRTLLTIGAVEGVGFGIITSMFVFLAEDVWKLGKLSAVLPLSYLVSGIVFMAPLLSAGTKLGKHLAVSLATLFVAITVPLAAFVPPHAPWIALAYMVLLGSTRGAIDALYYSMLSDVAHDDGVLAGRSRSGTMFSLFSMVGKLGRAAAIGLGYWLLAWVGFHPGGENASSTLLGFRLVYVLPPMAVEFIVAFLIWNFPAADNALMGFAPAQGRG